VVSHLRRQANPMGGGTVDLYAFELHAALPAVRYRDARAVRGWPPPTINWIQLLGAIIPARRGSATLRSPQQSFHILLTWLDLKGLLPERGRANRVVADLIEEQRQGVAGERRGLRGDGFFIGADGVFHLRSAAVRGAEHGPERSGRRKGG